MVMLLLGEDLNRKEKVLVFMIITRIISITRQNSKNDLCSQ